MESDIILGTYNLDSNGVSFTYTVPSSLPKEMMDKLTFQEPVEHEHGNLEKSDFNTLLKGIMNVPKQE